MGEFMLDYSDFILSSNSYKIIETDANENRISHAYLFVSQDENYLMEFAKKLAKLFINLSETENKSKNEIRIDNMSHPDVMFYGTSKENAIDAERTEEIISKVQVCPFEADKKIFILQNFNSVSEINQNKLLKVIEEPPKNTIFVLLSTTVSKILVTILSRVKQIELDKIPSNVITQMLVKEGINEKNAEIIANCANENALFAEKLSLDNSFLDFFNKIISCFFDMNSSKNVLAYSSYFNDKKFDKNEFFDISMLVCRDLMMIILGKSDLVIFKNALAKLKVIASSLNLSSLNVLVDSCVQAKQDLHYNANQTAVVDSFLFKLVEVKVKCRRLLV